MSNKLLKSELKEIVKECLVEILQEGIASDLSTITEKPINENNIRNHSRRSSFDHVSWANNRVDPGEIETPDYMEQALNLTDNSVLAEVLADSHKTMMGQMEAERLGKTVMAGDSAAREAASSDPVDLFGGSVGKWAALAFDESEK